MLHGECVVSRHFIETDPLTSYTSFCSACAGIYYARQDSFMKLCTSFCTAAGNRVNSLMCALVAPCSHGFAGTQVSPRSRKHRACSRSSSLCSSSSSSKKR